MTVKELIEYLETQPQDLQVVHEMYSEQCLLDVDHIKIRYLCEPRADGWVHDARPDKTLVPYLVFPGN